MGDNLATTIGSRIKHERRQRGWTLDQFAGVTGVSRRMVVSIEQGTANPSVGTLLKMSDALGIGLPSLVESAPLGTVNVVRRGRGTTLWRSESGGRAVLVAGTQPPDVAELWDWTLGPGDRYASEAHSTGTREVIRVVRGTLMVDVEPTSVTLRVGDAISYPGDVAHAYINATARPVRFTLAVFQPRVSAPSTRSHDV